MVEGRYPPAPRDAGADGRDDPALLAEAVALAVDAAATDGGPFGAVVARAGRVLGRGTNLVTATRDPTAHAEVVALRAAAATTGSHDLSGCVLYTSCAPCPMCRAAAFWARVDRVVHAATATDAAAAGFDDLEVADELRSATPVRLPIDRGAHPDPTAPFRAWAANPHRTPY